MTDSATKEGMAMGIPNGLHDHVVWTMDGRTWIEPTSDERQASPAFKRSLERGTVRLLPIEAVRKLIEEHT